MSSLILIHPTVWPQYTNVTDRQTDRQTDRETVQRSDSIGRSNRFTKGLPKIVEIGEGDLQSGCVINFMLELISAQSVNSAAVDKKSVCRVMYLSVGHQHQLDRQPWTAVAGVNLFRSPAALQRRYLSFWTSHQFISFPVFDIFSRFHFCSDGGVATGQ